MSIFDTNNFICLMVFLDRPIYRSRRDGRSKKRPGATLGLDVPWLTTPQIMHTHSRELCTRHAGIEPGQIWHTLPTFARVFSFKNKWTSTFAACSVPPQCERNTGDAMRWKIKMKSNKLLYCNWLKGNRRTIRRELPDVETAQPSLEEAAETCGRKRRP